MLGVQAPNKLYPNYHACPEASHVEKFREVSAPSPKVIGAHTLNCGPIFEFIIAKKIVGETPILMRISKPWPFSITCENLRKQDPLVAEM